MRTRTFYTIGRADETDALMLDVPTGTPLFFAETVNASIVPEMDGGEMVGILDPGTVLVCLHIETDPADVFHERMEWLS